MPWNSRRFCSRPVAHPPVFRQSLSGILFGSVALSRCSISTSAFSHCSRWTWRVSHSHAPRTLSSIVSTTTSLLMTDLDFGDDDFLADFDVDAAIQRQTASDATAASKNKRLKRTPLQDTTLTSSETPASVFPPNSKFSIGHTTNPKQERATTRIDAAPVPTGTITKLTPQFASLEDTLQHYFGFPKFRQGQLQVIEALVHRKQDAAVYWATGAGKSLCYQIPPLYTNKVAVVVSPLISLMQDQVRKLNGLLMEEDGSTKLATYLGTGQLDSSEESRALNGEYRLVYVTPEKLLSGGFLSALAHMHQNKKELCLIAIDESHCVSQWGHDFRPEYRQLDSIRSNPVLGQVPMVALTATAVPRVQQDIVSSLGLRNPTIVRQTFDRPNLRIHVAKKTSGGYKAAFSSDFLKKLQRQSSTILYAPTRDLVDEIASFLQQRFNATDSSLRVEAYHAGLSHDVRKSAHTNFLVGQTQVIVATTAFGMGIDKQDTRIVAHWGAPKTVEEYYQQIGRAGRDGLTAECHMFVSDADFDRYKGDFYAGALQGEAKQAMFRSIDALRRYSLDTEKCRRRTLLEFFNETPSFGERCGTCDTCQSLVKYGDDVERDFGPFGARIVLEAIDALPEQSLTNIEKVIAGNKVEDYRYRNGCNATAVQESIQRQRQPLSARKYSANFFKELVAPLAGKGYLEQGTRSTVVNGYSRSWSTYKLTLRGRETLRDSGAAITLPVPQSMREVEQKEEERRMRILKDLTDAGVKLEQIPKEEVDSGDGEVIRAFSKWHSHLERLQKNGRVDRHAELQDLFTRIEQWRSTAAIRKGMAPAAVMAEHLMASVAYAVATMRQGLKVDRSALVAAGVRSSELDLLVQALNTWIEEVLPPSDDSTSPVADSGKPMVFPADDVPFQPAKPWEHAVYKVVKKTGLASWESSHQRFLAGEHPQTIAMSPANGRPIQVSTVVGHIFDGLVQGRAVPLQRLSKFSTPPTKYEWEKLQEVERDTEMDVVADPNTSARDGGKFTLTEFLRPIMGDGFIDTPYNERPEDGKAKFGHWCEMLKWYMALRRIGYVPTFAE